MSTDPPTIDPLDMPSGCYIEKQQLVERNGVLRRETVHVEVSFRELKAEIERDMRILDTQFSPRDRLRNQRHNDGSYVEIEPYAGLRRTPRDAARLRQAERMLEKLGKLKNPPASPRK